MNTSIFRQSILLCFIVIFGNQAFAQNIPGHLSRHITAEQKLVGHLVKPNESIVSILKQYGNGVPGSPFKIEGAGGVLEQTKNLNPNIKNWDKLSQGTYIYVPVARQGLNKDASSTKPAPTKSTAQVSEPLQSQSIPQEDRSALAVSFVQQQAGFFKSDVELSDGEELEDSVLTISNTVRIGKYLSGEIKVATSSAKPQYETSFDDVTVSRMDYKAYTLSGNILIPSSFGTFALRGGLTKTSINTPARVSKDVIETTKIPVNRPNAPFAPVLGLSYQYVSRGGSFIQVENLATTWDEFSMEQAAITTGYRFLQTWYIGPAAFYERVGFKSLQYYNTKSMAVGMALGFSLDMDRRY